MGSEMCIRDSSPTERRLRSRLGGPGHPRPGRGIQARSRPHFGHHSFIRHRTAQHRLGSQVSGLAAHRSSVVHLVGIEVPHSCLRKGHCNQLRFKGSQNISWDNFAGIGFQRAKAFARTKSGKQFTLPGVTFNSLPRLSDASRGRIPDALTAGRDAADEKVVIVHRDGQQVLMSKEEYSQYLEKHPERAPKAEH